MKNLSLLAVFLLYTFSITSCNAQKADLVVTNAVIYSVDGNFSTFEAMAIKDGKILDLGSTIDMTTKYAGEETYDAKGKAIFPGFYDPHSHFVGLGRMLETCDLVGTESLEEIKERLKTYAKANPDKEWIIGRGWDQNDWPIKKFPNKKVLDDIFPDKPVVLTRIDGHAAFINSAALKKAKITSGSKVDGGEVILEDGEPSGILVDNAMGFLKRVMPTPTKNERKEMILNAQALCLEKGLTSVSDAGLQQEDIELIDQMHKSGELKIRDYIMVSLGLRNLKYYIKKGIIKTDRMHVRSFKLYADGALGSRGACLIEPYSDKNSTSGFLLLSEKELRLSLEEIYNSDYQANTHCIGDSANRLILDIYADLLKGKNNRRWRIEHSQIIHPDDMHKFGENQIIPSIQGTHATSDMYWAEERLGKDRVKSAYAFKQLLAQNGVLPNGSDFPVEAVNPLFGFHSLFARQDANNYPEGGYQMENALTREESLKAMTIWSAYANFEENERGSLEKGKLADFVILEKDIMQIPKEEVRETKVLSTYINGEKVYEAL
ncbi:hypothetical protein SAMN06298216_0956 [Spirosomataceae bacterium TFI 002]|nr:hypothetical protein SAMN06298216_0956 [Spirosomataceae bacterium TFI 002]